MKIKQEGGGVREGSLVELGEKRVRMADNSKIKLFARKTLKLNCLQRNLSIFIASVYMESRKVLKEIM